MKNFRKSSFSNYYLNILRPDLINKNIVKSPNFFNSLKLLIFSNFGVSNMEDPKIFKILRLFYFFSKQRPYFSSFFSLKKERNCGGVFIGGSVSGRHFFHFLDYLYFFFFPRLNEKYISYKFTIVENFFFSLNDLGQFSFLVEDIFRYNFSVSFRGLNSDHNETLSIVTKDLLIFFSRFLKQ